MTTAPAPPVDRALRAYLHLLDDEGSADAALRLTRYANGAWAIEIGPDEGLRARPLLCLPPGAGFDEGLGRLLAALVARS